MKCCQVFHVGFTSVVDGIGVGAEMKASPRGSRGRGRDRKSGRLRPADGIGPPGWVGDPVFQEGCVGAPRWKKAGWQAQGAAAAGPAPCEPATGKASALPQLWSNLSSLSGALRGSPRREDSAER